MYEGMLFMPKQLNNTEASLGAGKQTTDKRNPVLQVHVIVLIYRTDNRSEGTTSKFTSCTKHQISLLLINTQRNPAR